MESTVAVTRPVRHSVLSFARWVADSCPPGARVLDIGAGENRSGTLRPILARQPCLVGVDPDPSILRNDVLDERHVCSMEAFADDHPGEFDLAFAVFVLEHVSDPVAFTEACARVLRPGGSLFALTLNRNQYFGFTTWAATRLHVADWALERLKGRDTVARYHFPTEYRLNTTAGVVRHLDRAGFRSVELRCFEDTRRYAWYLPTALKWFPPLYTRAAYAAGQPGLMGHLSFHAVR